MKILGYDNLLVYIIKKYPAKDKIEWFLYLGLILLIIAFWIWAPIVDSLFPKISSAVIINSWTPAYLIFLFYAGWLTAHITSLRYKKFLFQESEKKFKQLLKTYHYSRGFLVLPFFFAIFYDGIFSIPIDVYGSTGNIFHTLLFSSFGFFLFVSLFSQIRPDASFFSFFYVDRDFDFYRILKCLKSGSKTRDDIKKFVKKPEKMGEWLKMLEEKKLIIFQNNNYRLSPKWKL